MGASIGYDTDTQSVKLIPSFPKGASFESILLACHWLIQSKSLSHSRSKFFGDDSHRIGVLAQGANLFAERALGGTISGREIAIHNSAWPVYSSLMRLPMAETCLTDLISGSNPAVWHQFIKPIEVASYAKEWRACPACCREDTGSNGCGIGHWRVIHQLPGVTFCPQHLNPLQYRCSACKSPLGGQELTAMPGWPCLKCGCGEKDELQANRTSASKALLGLYLKLLNNEGISLGPAHRGKLHQISLGRSPTKDAIELYINRFVADFEFSDLFEMGAFLGIDVTKEGAVLAVLGGNSCPAPLNLALSAFALNNEKDFELMVSEDKQRISGWPSENSVVFLPDSSGIAEICRLAADFAIPEEAVNHWIQGASAAAICGQFLIARKTFRNFFKSLPIYLRTFLQLDKDIHRVGFFCLGGASDEETKRFHREKIESALSLGAVGRSGLTKVCNKSYCWCRWNDNEWLAKAVTRKN